MITVFLMRLNWEINWNLIDSGEWGMGRGTRDMGKCKIQIQFNAKHTKLMTLRTVKKYMVFLRNLHFVPLCAAHWV
jgi:hypothetical protein